MSVAAVETVDLAKTYPKVEALRGLSLRIEPGEIFALLGPNGAGKTTWISIVCGLVRPTGGTASILGHDVVRDALAARRLVGLVPQEVNFDPFFTPREVLRFQMGYYGVPPDNVRIDEVLAALDLSAKADTNTRALSGGMKRRLLIAKALVPRPRVAFLDEPTAGVDVALRHDLWSYVRTLRAQGTTIVLTTHYLEEAEALADRVAVIDKGALVGLDTPAALVRQLGRKQIRFRLATPWTAGAAALPEPLRRRGATLDAERRDGDLPRRQHADRRAAVARRIALAGGGRRGDRPALAGRRVPAADQAPRRRQLHPAIVMNGIGFRTLLAKETRRFLKVPGQTLAQPVVTTTLYFLVFGFALGGRVREVDGVSYIRFIIPGLVLLTLTQNAFLNTSSSMFIAKMQGTIVDLLIAPLGVADLLAAFLAAAVLRGFLTGGLVWLISGLFTGFSVAHPLWVLLYMLLIATAFAAIGLAVAIWSDKFEQLNVVPTFVLTPLTFLGGVFYSARMLPRPWDTITRLNPVLYMVEGLRFGFLGTSSSSPYLGLAITGAVVATATILTTWMLATGYKLRS